MRGVQLWRALGLPLHGQISVRWALLVLGVQAALNRKAAKRVSICSCLATTVLPSNGLSAVSTLQLLQIVTVQHDKLLAGGPALLSFAAHGLGCPTAFEGTTSPC